MCLYFHARTKSVFPMSRLGKKQRPGVRLGGAPSKFDIIVIAQAADGGASQRDRERCGSPPLPKQNKINSGPTHVIASERASKT